MGKHSIPMATDDINKITVVYGENGTGKSNLLNALYWCLTGSFSSGLKLDAGLKILNQRKTIIVKYVECLFIICDEKTTRTSYIAIRTLYTARKGDLVVMRKETSGENFEPVMEPTGLVRRFFPRELVPWLFFDGEYVNQVNIEVSTALYEKVRQFSGFQFYTAQDLKTISQKLKQKILKDNKLGKAEKLLADVIKWEAQLLAKKAKENSC